MENSLKKENAISSTSPSNNVITPTLNEEIKNCSSIFLLISSYNSAIHFEESAKKWMSARKIKFIVNHKKIDSLLQNSNYKNLIYYSFQKV